MDITEKIRIKLKKSREAMNLSLDDVAAVSGLKKEELEDIEKGSKEISIAILEKLSYVYGMSQNYFLTDKEEPELIFKYETDKLSKADIQKIEWVKRFMVNLYELDEISRRK